jgi:hypothetical protein
MAYTEPQIRELIEKFTQADREPTLSQVEIDDLVQRSKRQDSAKRPPTDADWEPTWNINAAVALAWELKAGAVATDFDIRSADQDLKRSQMQAMCLKQADRWKARVTESPQLEGSLKRNLPQGVQTNANDELWDCVGGCSCGGIGCSSCGGGIWSPGVIWRDDP